MKLQGEQGLRAYFRTTSLFEGHPLWDTSGRGLKYIMQPSHGIRMASPLSQLQDCSDETSGQNSRDFELTSGPLPHSKDISYRRILLGEISSLLQEQFSIHRGIIFVNNGGPFLMGANISQR